MIEFITNNIYLSILIVYILIGFFSANVIILYTLLEFYSEKEKIDELEEIILLMFYIFFIVAYPYMLTTLLKDVIKARRYNKKTYL
jgi:O-antigen ligase